MDLFPFMVAKATLPFLAAVLMVEYSIRKRDLLLVMKPTTR